ncbi:SiaB family protein kinase [uncultured Microscilla sp.]|uniref:SiaB family protein kinase n=1 Tax=uncultured Microscilla sp. TaxID=432653 RepID=UPI002606B280|nr:SiaB family protein kinase [uncultured Microscilla sp.]
MLKDENIILSHNGALDSEVIDLLLDLTDKKLTKLKIRRGVRKKIFNILVECLQNTLHYIKEFDEDIPIVHSPFLIVIKKENSFIISTGNFVTEDRAEFLKTKLSEINTLSQEDLQKHYIQALDKKTLPTEGGAGLGLVDIVRRSKHRVLFDFQEIITSGDRLPNDNTSDVGVMEDKETYLLFNLQIEVAR